MAKTHYAPINRIDKDDNDKVYYEVTHCGLHNSKSPVTNDIQIVSCIKCIDIFYKFKNYESEAES